MTAVVGLLTESVTEALKGFFKVRKALFALQSIGDAERAFSIAYRAKTQTGVDTKENGKPSLSTTDSIHRLNTNEDGDAVFVDAEEVADSHNGVHQDMGKLSLDPNNRANSSRSDSISRRLSVPPPTAGFVDSSLLTNPTDLFIHSGYCMHRGMILLLLSLVPPSFSRILGIVGFRGDREAGISLLWEAVRSSSKHGFKTSDPEEANNSAVNGACAGLVLLGYFRMLVSVLDISPAGSMPEDRLQALLRTMRSKFPGSRLWMLEEARMHSSNRNVPAAIEVLEEAEPPGAMKQVEAFRWFEHGLATMFMHEYQKCADSFVKCIGLNNWSHGMYYYIACSAHVELYRKYTYGFTSLNPSKAKEHAAKAKELMAKVPEVAGKKTMMGKQLPFDRFVLRKIQKWQARAKQWNISVVDAVGVSPIEEMNFFWGGYRKMSPEEMKVSLRRLWWSDGGALEGDSVERVEPDTEPSPMANKESNDEKAVLSLLRAALHRQLGDTTSARRLLRTHIIDGHSLDEFRGDLKENWAPPIARYEMAVCAWTESGAGRTEGMESTPSKVHPSIRKKRLLECGKLLDEVAASERYDLDSRFGIKITTGQDTLKKVAAMQ